MSVEDGKEIGTIEPNTFFSQSELLFPTNLNTLGSYTEAQKTDPETDDHQGLAEEIVNLIKQDQGRQIRAIIIVLKSGEKPSVSTTSE